MQKHTSTRMHRRNFLKAAGFAAVAAGGLASPVLASRRAAADTSVDAFLAAYLGARARSATDADARILDGFVDTANPTLDRFERERAAFLRGGAGTLWDGTILSVRSSFDVRELTMISGGAVAFVDEVASADWIQNVRTPTAVQAALYAQHPEKYIGAPQGSRGEVTSRWMIPHDIHLTQQPAGGWRVASDAYDQAMGIDRSPDLQPGSKAAIWYGKIAGTAAGAGLVSPSSPSSPTEYRRPPGMSAIPPIGPGRLPSYDPNVAVSYAHTYWNLYYPPYCDYNDCGGDCANFVSQCFRQAGDGDSGLWSTYSGGCGTCGTSATFAGTDTWANNLYLHDFILNSGRGQAWFDIASMGIGDFINYDIYGDWFMRHIVLVTAGAPGSNPLVTGHNLNCYDAPYTTFSGNRYLTWR